MKFWAFARIAFATRTVAGKFLVVMWAMIGGMQSKQAIRARVGIAIADVERDEVRFAVSAIVVLLEPSILKGDWSTDPEEEFPAIGCCVGLNSS